MIQPASCCLCGKECYEIEASDEGTTWHKDGKPCPPYEPWVDTFRLWRTCNLNDDAYDKDDNRTGWVHSMKLAIRQWNEMQGLEEKDGR